MSSATTAERVNRQPRPSQWEITHLEPFIPTAHTSASLTAATAVSWVPGRRARRATGRRTRSRR